MFFRVVFILLIWALHTLVFGKGKKYVFCIDVSDWRNLNILYQGSEIINFVRGMSTISANGAHAWNAWMDRLENARSSELNLSSKISAGNTVNLGTSVFALQQSVSRLRREYDSMTSTPTSNTVATPQELRRREESLKTLENQTKLLLNTYNKRSQGTRG
jgi:hypothetical protein